MAQQTLNVYGFMDFNVEKLIVEDNNFLHLYVPDDIQYGLNHANLYFDFNPNSSSRALVEVAFNSRTTTQAGQSGFVYNLHTNAGTIPLPGGASIPVAASDTVLAQVPGSRAVTIQNFVLERAWLELKFNRYANLRFGRFITPAGIWNVDHGSPVILTVAQPYQTSLLPIFPIRQDGIMLAGATFFGDHDLEYKLYLSSGSETTNDIEDMNDFGGGGNLRATLDLPISVKVGVSGYSGMVREAYMRQTVNREEDFADIMTQSAGGTIAPYMMSWDHADADYQFVTTTEMRETAIGVDLRLDINEIGLQGEFNMKTQEDELKGNGDQASWYGWYALACYKVRMGTRSLTPYFKYERLWWEDLDAVSSPIQYSPLIGFQSYMVGLNIALSANIRLKLEAAMNPIEVSDESVVPPTALDGTGLTVEHSYSDSDLLLYGVSAQASIAF
jgi:hypothetical protein